MILKDKVAIVTGASTGIGRAVALGFAAEGAHVVINYNRSEAAAGEVFRQIEDMGRKPLLVKGDLALEEDVKKILSATHCHSSRKRAEITNHAIGMEKLESGLSRFWFGS